MLSPALVVTALFAVGAWNPVLIARAGVAVKVGVKVAVGGRGV